MVIYTKHTASDTVSIVCQGGMSSWPAKPPSYTAPKKVRSAKSVCPSQSLCNSIHDRRPTPQDRPPCLTQLQYAPAQRKSPGQRAPAPTSSPSPSTDSAGYSSRNCKMTFCASQSIISNLKLPIPTFSKLKIDTQNAPCEPRARCGTAALAVPHCNMECKVRAGTYG